MRGSTDAAHEHTGSTRDGEARRGRKIQRSWWLEIRHNPKKKFCDGGSLRGYPSVLLFLPVKGRPAKFKDAGPSTAQQFPNIVYAHR
jgi:hypothetical protein